MAVDRVTGNKTGEKGKRKAERGTWKRDKSSLKGKGGNGTDRLFASFVEGLQIAMRNEVSDRLTSAAQETSNAGRVLENLARSARQAQTPEHQPA